MIMHPAPENSGIVFRRGDLPGQPQLRATLDKAHATQLALSLSAGELRIERAELLLAALAGCGIDNALIELDGPEPPDLDGCAAAFAFLIACAGRQPQDAPRRGLLLTRPLRLSAPGRYALLRPSAEPQLRLRAAERRCSHHPNEDDFARSLAPARRVWEDSQLRALSRRGLLRGWDEKKGLMLRGAQSASPEGQRFADEALRHELCRSLGTLSLLGGPLRGTLLLRGASLGMILRLLRRLQRAEDSHIWREEPEAAAAESPGEAEAPGTRTQQERPFAAPVKAIQGG